jgi:hypothetical protein
MNIAVCQTTKDEYLFLDYRGRWRSIADLKKVQPKTFASGIPHRYQPPEAAALWAEPYPELPNLKRRGVLSD